MSHLVNDYDAQIPRSVETIQFPRWHKLFISIVVLLYFGTVTVCNLPSSDTKDRIMSRLRALVNLFSISQVWNMFGTGARPWHQRMVANITFADGSTKIYEFPRMELMSLSERYMREKMRKLFVDALPSTDFAEYLPDICRTLARANADAENEPMLVTLFLKVGEIPAPNGPIVGRHDLPHRLHTDILIVYKVKESDLLQP